MGDLSDFASREPTPEQRQRQQHRQALIAAAMEVVVQKGVSHSAPAEIAACAGLPQDLIERYFGSKDGLMEAVIAEWSDQYYDLLDRMIARTGERPQDRIVAIVRGDLSEELLNPLTVVLWYAFRGEARERAAIAAHCTTRDARLRTMTRVACLEIARAEGMADAETVARDATAGVLALLEGMWADYLLHPHQFDREAAARVAFRFLAALFPRHFDLNGAI